MNKKIHHSSIVMIVYSEVTDRFPLIWFQTSINKLLRR